jgi:hypothetical protein
MTNLERRQLVSKAKIDRLAFEAAQLLSRGETSKATTLVGECVTQGSREQLAIWLRHYATTRFQISGRAVDAFLGSVPPVDVAL